MAKRWAWYQNVGENENLHTVQLLLKNHLSCKVIWKVYPKFTVWSFLQWIIIECTKTQGTLRSTLLWYFIDNFFCYWNYYIACVIYHLSYIVMFNADSRAIKQKFNSGFIHFTVFTSFLIDWSSVMIIIQKIKHMIEPGFIRHRL